MPAATASQLSALRLEITTRAPWAAICCAMALPIPRLEPVISATLPDRSKSDMGGNLGVERSCIVPRGWRRAPMSRYRTADSQ
jgi:hypothetical protein